MATITNLKDDNNDILYPITKVECVYDNNNNNVSDLMSNLATKTLSNVVQPPITTSGTYAGNDRVIETYISNDGQTWYRKWASGWKECSISVNITTSWTYYTLPLHFTTLDYTTICQPTTVSINNASASIDGQTTNQVYLRSYSGTGRVLVYCCGY